MTVHARAQERPMSIASPFALPVGPPARAALAPPRRGRRVLPAVVAATVVALFASVPAPASAQTAAPGGAELPAYAPGVTVANAASADSIRSLVAVTEARELAERSIVQAERMMQRAIENGVQGRKLEGRQKQVIEKAMQRMTAALREEMRWDRMEPILIEVYRRSFTQSEVDGMLEFYRSPAGRAVTAKMPVVQQYSMTLVQAQMQSLMPKLQQIQREAAAELQRPDSGT
jgi:hypothetical protein